MWTADPSKLVKVLLHTQGADVERTIDWDGRGRSVYLRDPAGNSVELVDGEIWPK